MIEDDVFLIKLYRDQLTREGFEFITATTGVEGLNKVTADHPDLILLDLILPRKMGLMYSVILNPIQRQNTFQYSFSQISPKSRISKKDSRLGHKIISLKPTCVFQKSLKKSNQLLTKRNN